jgi:short-subunit dehydrogenase
MFQFRRRAGMQSLKGKTIIITGASAGVGEATAHLCAKESANVVLAARSRESLEALARKIGKQALPVVTDVMNPEDCEHLLNTAAEKFSRIDGLVNNAGFNSRGPVETVPLEDFEKVIDVNLKAPMRLSKMVLPYMKAGGGGAIVNVASLAGRVPLDHEAAYSASKFGLRAFSFAMAEELAGTGITVSVVSPGPIATGFILDDIECVPDLVFSQPVCKAEQVARAIVASLKDGKRERVMDFFSGMMAHIGYLAPGVRAAFKPMLEAKGRRTKDRYRKARK